MINTLFLEKNSFQYSILLKLTNNNTNSILEHDLRKEKNGQIQPRVLALAHARTP